MANELLNALNRALDEMASQSQLLARRIEELCLRNTPEGNRRNLTPEGTWADRRAGERREPHRAVPGRREQDSRRRPPEDRIAEWHEQLSEVLMRSMELDRHKRLLHS